MATHVVTVFLRHDAAVLLLERSDAVGSYPGRWGGVAGHVEADDPDRAAVRRAAISEIGEETGLADHVTLVRCGSPFAVLDDTRDTEWMVHPCLYDCTSRAVTPNEETTDWAWVPPPTILDRDTVPDLWRSYTAVAPTVETIRGDRTHGSTYLSVRALEVLRDRAAVAARRGTATDLPALARDLRASRPGMAAVTNRVNRAMAAANDAGSITDPATVERAASDGIDAALAADDRAAATAAESLGDRVVTTSRSGTVEAVLRDAAVPVLVAEARPGGEGTDLATVLAADGVDVTLTPDATAPGRIEATDTVLVGADAVLPDGSVHNKVGTYPLAVAAARADADCYAVCAADKIVPDGTVATPEAPADTIDHPPGVSVENPLLETTPAALIDGIITDRGLLAPAAIADLAADLAALGTWSD